MDVAGESEKGLPAEHETEPSPRRGISRFADISFVEPDENDPGDPTDPQRRRNGRVLAAAIGVGGALVLAIAVVGIIAVRHYLDDTSSIRAQMSLKYHAQYRTCLENGGVRKTCATRAELACAADPGWATDSHVLDDVADICRFGADARG